MSAVAPITDERALELARQHLPCGARPHEILAFARALLSEHEASRIAPALEQRIVELGHEVEVAP